MYWLAMTTLIVIFLGVAVAVASAIRRYSAEGRMQRLGRQAFQDRIASAVQRREAEPVVAAWAGKRVFVIDRKKRECEGITSFYLTPQDKRPLPSFRPGQYLTVSFQVPGKKAPVMRCYTLSDCWNEHYYRISVKHMLPPRDHPQAPPGLASSYLHESLHKGDTIEIQAPRGDFVIDPAGTRPVVLLAGGVGITPVLAMAKALAKVKSKREVWFFYGVRDGAEQGFTPELLRLIENLANLHLRVCFSRRAVPGNDLSSTVAPIAVSTELPYAAINRVKATLIRTDTEEYCEIKAAGTVVGRDPDFVDIVLKDVSKVSRRHARFSMLGEIWCVEDLNSHNGTYINGEQVGIGKTPIQSGDRIEFARGGLECRFFVETVNEEEPATLDRIVFAENELPSTAATSVEFESTIDAPSIVLEEQFIIGERISVDLLKRLLPSSNFEFYLCGPPPMMEAMTRDLKVWGVPQDDLHYELFGPASVKSMTGDETSQPSKVTFARSEIQGEWRRNSLLEFALESNVDIPYNCRAGSCGTCKIRIIEGQVEYGDQAPTAPHEDDECLMCVARPRGDVLLDA